MVDEARAAPDWQAERGDGLSPAGRIAIVAGSGTLPASVADAIVQKGQVPFILGLSGNADAGIERFPHAYVHIGQVGRLLSTLRRQGCTHVVFIGGLRRPNLFRVRVDAGFFRNLPQLLPLFKGGDDTVLRKVARFFERRGFDVLAAHEIAPELLAPKGAFSKSIPSAEDFDDIKLAFSVTHALGLFDIGQGAVVARNYVLAVEAAEGTDAMLQRCRALNNWGFTSRKGVLLKRAKPGQDLRLDMPAIGPRTVDLAAEAGLAGIAVEAGAVILAELAELVEKADRRGLFLYGVSSAELNGTQRPGK